MYNPYRQKGEWLDCDICKTSHRKILDSDLLEYANPVLTEEERSQCYECKPIMLPFNRFCTVCNKDSEHIVSYGDVLPKICLHCGNDPDAHLQSSIGIYEKRPTLQGGAKELFNRIKKRNIGSNMPDY